MPLFLSSDALKEAVDRLGVSRARPVLCDFLILKFAMSLGDGTATLGLRDPLYMQSVRRLALAVQEDQQAITPEPFFNPFGASRQVNRGWRSAKYPSNGPNVTVNGGNWRRVVDILSQGPRRVQFTSDYVDHLAAVVVTREAEFPQEADAAAWFFRFEDVEPLIGTNLDETALIQAFESQVGLTASERAVIFGAS